MISNKRQLYICESVYQLFNAVVLRMTVFPDTPADVLLTEHTDFSQISVELEKTGLFGAVLQPVCRPKQYIYYTAPPERQADYLRDPEALIGTPLGTPYTDFFVPVDHIYAKLLYYQQLKRGHKPSVHFYEEGMRAYTIDILKNEQENEPSAADDYGSDSFALNIANHYLYVPELFSVQNIHYQLKPIPKIDPNNQKLKDMLTAIFSTGALPEERFIFFEESNFCDRQLTNDFQIFQSVAQTLGKDNIIVKRHPRNTVDRFTPAGYRVMEGHGIPWEMQLLHHDISKKVLVTIVSTASVTPFFLFGKPVPTIHLKHLFMGKSFLLSDAPFSAFYNKMILYFNQKDRMIHLPQSIEEFDEIIRYLNVYGF